MDNTTMNYSDVTEEDAGLNTESIPEMAENMENEVDAADMDGVSESTEPTRSDNCMITEEMVQEELAKMDSMNYIELLQYERSLQNHKESIIQAKEAVEQLLATQKQLEVLQQGEDEKPDDFASKLAAENVQDDTGLHQEEINEFLANYDISIKRMDETLEAYQAKIKEFDDISKTSTFMNNAMVEIAEKRLASIESDDTGRNLKPMKIYYENMKSIYLNRDSVEYVLEKIPNQQIMLRRWVDTVKKEAKQNKDSVIRSTQKNVSNAFCSVFSVNQMRDFESYLKKVFNVEEDETDNSVFIVQYVLYLIYIDRKARTRGLHKWIEMIIMNVIDINADNYDLPNGVDYFNEQLLKIRDAVMAITPKI
jgi:hypothetical protein